MDVNQAGNDGRLPCGTAVAALIEQACDGRGRELTAHQRACPYCPVTLAELERRWTPVRRLAAAPVVVPADLLRSVMHRVRQLMSDRWLALRAGGRGTTRVTRWAVARLVAIAAREVPGVRVALSRVAGTRATAPPWDAHPPGAAPAERALVDLDLVTEYGEDLVEVTAAVRRTVMERLTATTGLQVDRVDITVSDIAPRLPAQPGAPAPPQPPAGTAGSRAP